MSNPFWCKTCQKSVSRKNKARHIATHNKNTTQNQSPTSHDTHILFIATSAVEDIAKCSLLGIRVDLTDHEALRSRLHKVVTRKNTAQLKADLGPPLLSERDGEPVVHQAVMTMLLVKGLISAELKTLDWLRDRIDSNKLLGYIRSKPARRLVVLVSCTNCIWSGLSLRDFYIQMRVIAPVHGKMVVCLSETEALWAVLKIGDIRALDEIAQKADQDGNSDFSYRPRTCFGIGECTLLEPSGEKVVLKRTYSCGAGHVKIVDASARTNLNCFDPSKYRTASSRQTGNNELFWFHQEYVDSFKKFGEFRVFLSQGKVICAARTKFVSDSKSCAARSKFVSYSKSIALQPVSRTDFAWFSDDSVQQERKLTQLYEFSELICSLLLERDDAREHYASLRIGVRLDVGVSELSPDGKFFGGEVTRFTSADQFSEDILCNPFTDICEAWANAIVQEYGT